MLEYDMALVKFIFEGLYPYLQGYKGLYASLLFYKSTKASSVLRLPSIVYFINSILKSS